MKLTEDVYVVGGGRTGFGISGPLDCHIYLVHGGSELALVDVGLGLPGDFEEVLANVRQDGLDPRRIRKVILTHYHADHVGAAAEASERLDAEVIASHAAAPAIRSGDEAATAVDVARAGGMYPADFRLQACRVHRSVGEGDRIQVGDLWLDVWETPGHCAGHLSFLMPGRDRVYLIGGDLVFWGGKVVLQNIHDCRIPDHADSMEKAAKLAFDALLPGHLQISLRNGKEHVDAAVAAFRRLSVPPNLT